MTLCCKKQTQKRTVAWLHLYPKDLTKTETCIHRELYSGYNKTIGPGGMKQRLAGQWIKIADAG